jgi:hypothetical protein
MWHQPRIGAPAVEALAVSAHWDFGVGWVVTLTHRHSGSGWGECDNESYDHLTTEEMIDVLTVALETTLTGAH